MGNETIVILSASDAASATGTAIDVGQEFAASFQASCTDTSAAGTIQIQMSNDIPPAGYLGIFVPTHWTNITGATATIAAGVMSAPIILNPMCFRYIRAVYTSSGAGTGTIHVNMNAQAI
jgi:hypothetical protein